MKGLVNNIAGGCLSSVPVRSRFFTSWIDNIYSSLFINGLFLFVTNRPSRFLNFQNRTLRQNHGWPSRWHWTLTPPPEASHFTVYRLPRNVSYQFLFTPHELSTSTTHLVLVWLWCQLSLLSLTFLL